MNDRIKKLSSWGMPIVIISGILYLTVSFINGDEIKMGSPKSFLGSISTSVSLFFEKNGSAAPRSQTTKEIVPADSYVFTPTSTSPTPTSTSPTSTSQNNKISSSIIPAPTSTPQKNKTSTIFTGNVQKKTYPAGELTSSPGGLASSTNFSDLSINIVDTGILNNDIFVHATSVQPGQKAAVVFDVKNIGGKASSEWIFSAQIPTPSANFTSETQAGLAPEEGIRFTMAFSNLLSSGTNNVSFTVDPSVRISSDPDRKNNAASTTLFRNY